VNTTGVALARTPQPHEQWGSVLEVAAREVFELMLGCKLSISETSLPLDREMTAMVGLAGQLRGVMSLRCSVASSTLMASRMLGVSPDEIGPQGCDAFGEICNMIAGNFKNKISGLGNGCMLSVPTVIIGSDYDLRPLSDSKALEVTLVFENMPITISLQVHN
jgi:chemotaxis protein CheX